MRACVRVCVCERERGGGGGGQRKCREEARRGPGVWGWVGAGGREDRGWRGCERPQEGLLKGSPEMSDYYWLLK